MEYHSLIAALPDLQPDQTTTVVSLEELKNELPGLLSEYDASLLKLIFARYDNENWLKYLTGKDTPLHPLGNLDADDMARLVVLMRENEHPKDEKLSPYIHEFYITYSDDTFVTEGVSQEDYLAGLYFRYAMQSKNEFVRAWFEFNLNVNNILTALASREHGYDLRRMVAGNNEVARTIRRSNARDLGLAGMFDELEVLLRIADEPDLLEREKKIDALKWNWLDEHTFFHYFTIERILAFVLKVQMIERWKPLTVEKGEEMFRYMLSEMKQSASFRGVN